MTLKNAIKRAKDARPNLIDEEVLAAWIYELEGQISEHMGKEMPVNTWPDDAELLMPAPYDGIYDLYLRVKIDDMQQEDALYQNDHAVFNDMLGSALAWWLRNNRPKQVYTWNTGL